MNVPPPKTAVVPSDASSVPAKASGVASATMSAEPSPSGLKTVGRTVFFSILICMNVILVPTDRDGVGTASRVFLDRDVAVVPDAIPNGDACAPFGDPEWGAIAVTVTVKDIFLSFLRPGISVARIAGSHFEVTFPGKDKPENGTYFLMASEREKYQKGQTGLFFKDVCAWVDGTKQP